MEQEVDGSGLEHTIFRPSFVFGRTAARCRRSSRRFATRRVVTVIGDGRQRSQPIWVDDVAAYVAQRDRPPAGGEPDLRARRPGHRRLERALPADREGARQAAAARPRPVRRSPQPARALTRAATGRAALGRPGEDARRAPTTSSRTTRRSRPSTCRSSRSKSRSAAWSTGRRCKRAPCGAPQSGYQPGFRRGASGR